MATAKEAYRAQKADSPSIKRWLKWAMQRYLPARKKSQGQEFKAEVVN